MSFHQANDGNRVLARGSQKPARESIAEHGTPSHPVCCPDLPDPRLPRATHTSRPPRADAPCPRCGRHLSVCPWALNPTHACLSSCVDSLASATRFDSSLLRCGRPAACCCFFGLRTNVRLALRARAWSRETARVFSRAPPAGNISRCTTRQPMQGNTIGHWQDRAASPASRSGPAGPVVLSPC